MQNPHFDKAKLFSEKLEFYNLALGSCTSVQNLYELHRERNKEILANAALIVTESNVNSIYNSHHEKIPLAVLFRNIYLFYKSLAALQKPAVSILLPTQTNPNKDKINDFHKKMCAKFGVNLIDIAAYADRLNLTKNFIAKIDVHHIQSAIMREFGRNIALNIANFHAPKPLRKGFKPPKFSIITPKNMSVVCGDFEKIHSKNSMYDEIAYKMTSPTKARFSPNFSGHFLLAFHSWCDGNPWSTTQNLSKFIIKNAATSIIKSVWSPNVVLEFHNEFTLDDESFLLYRLDETAKFTENYHAAAFQNPAHTISPFLSIIAFLLMEKREFLAQKREFEATLAEPICELDERYNFSHLVPNIELYRQIVDEYCELMSLCKMDNELKARNEAFECLRNAKILKIYLKIGGKILPSKRARKQCRRLLGLLKS